MKTWSELQEWVELRAEEVAQKLLDSDRVALGSFDVHSTLQELDPVQRDAVAWKFYEAVADHYTKLAEGFCESYYRDLKRKFEEES